MNIPRHDHKQQIYAQHVISQAGLHLHDLTAALSDYHTYSEQRLHALFPTLSPVNDRVSRQSDNVNCLSLRKNIVLTLLWYFGSPVKHTEKIYKVAVVKMC